MISTLKKYWAEIPLWNKYLLLNHHLLHTFLAISVASFLSVVGFGLFVGTLISWILFAIIWEIAGLLSGESLSNSISDSIQFSVQWVLPVWYYIGWLPGVLLLLILVSLYLYISYAIQKNREKSV